jgi:hypothetical protein
MLLEEAMHVGPVETDRLRDLLHIPLLSGQPTAEVFAL